MLDNLFSLLKAGAITSGTFAMIGLLVAVLEDYIVASTADKGNVRQQISLLSALCKAYLTVFVVVLVSYFTRLSQPLPGEINERYMFASLSSGVNFILLSMFGLFLSGLLWRLLGRVKEREEVEAERVLQRRQREEVEGRVDGN